MVVAFGFTAGLQLPVMPLLEVVAKVNEAPAQMGAMLSNVGVRFGLITTESVLVVAHCPLVGVNVYVVVSALFTAGLQVPVMPLLDVVGKVKLLPAQTGAMLSNVGTIGSFTTTVNWAVVAHAPAFGEKV